MHLRKQSSQAQVTRGLQKKKNKPNQPLPKIKPANTIELILGDEPPIPTQTLVTPPTEFPEIDSFRKKLPVSRKNLFLPLAPRNDSGSFNSVTPHVERPVRRRH